MEERILVCLSSSPSNGKIIRTAAQMAEAFNGTLTALFVETPLAGKMGKEDQERLKWKSISYLTARWDLR